MSRVVVDNLWKEYGERVVLERVSVEVEPHSFVSIVGAQGCGKSTFLRLLAGVEQPTRGTIQIDGVPVPNEPGPHCAVVFPRHTVFPHLTVLGNVLLGLEFAQAPWRGRLFGAAREAAIAEAARCLDEVGLTAARDQYPAALSPAMRQRLALAQSLAPNPALLVLDAPFAGLAAAERKELQALLTRLWAARAITMFMVADDLSEGFALGTRLLVFDKIRLDPGVPDAYGATITYDLPLKRQTAEREARLALAPMLRRAQR